MKNSTNTYVLGLLRIGTGLVYLASLLLINGCKGCGAPSQETSHKEIVTFYGHPGVGKRTLCNTIFKKVKFESGINIAIHHNQEYIFENKVYMVTPGLADKKRQKEAAQEIGEALKKNGNYKIIFVITLGGVGVNHSHREAVNTVCKAIDTPFEYGLIINKVEKAIIPKIKTDMDDLIKLFAKKPSSICVIPRNESIAVKNNAFIKNSAIREELINFIDNLQANNPQPN